MQNLDELYEMIVDRKKNPKEGSYTDYLFNKGLDKILKKVGEESTEVVVAAKNPDKPRGDGELVYESADLLYHLCVLWVEQGVTFDQIKTELAKREGLMSEYKDRPEIKDL
ncbi:phosphoribosyl-ATP diphosphatase [Companilactobacillus furfuricola]|uniref:phosphoribosyl-ATP diphosphatase n=1 Tax=Companilactobacillus furfuricola TaxID=1462575 RepID=UPI000F79EA40|nr:phosphoribosyl-ATP diphosphatase [Companilactobacillus furfuricola]